MTGKKSSQCWGSRKRRERAARRASTRNSAVEQVVAAAIGGVVGHDAIVAAACLPHQHIDVLRQQKALADHGGGRRAHLLLVGGTVGIAHRERGRGSPRPAAPPPCARTAGTSRPSGRWPRGSPPPRCVCWKPVRVPSGTSSSGSAIPGRCRRRPRGTSVSYALPMTGGTASAMRSAWRAPRSRRGGRRIAFGQANIGNAGTSRDRRRR